MFNHLHLDGEVDVADFEVVQMRSSSLTNEAAKHRISVKPKSRRLASKVSMRKREVGRRLKVSDDIIRLLWITLNAH